MFSQYFFFAVDAPHFIVACKTFSSTPRVSDKKDNKKVNIECKLECFSSQCVGWKDFSSLLEWKKSIGNECEFLRKDVLASLTLFDSTQRGLERMLRYLRTFHLLGAEIAIYFLQFANSTASNSKEASISTFYLFVCFLFTLLHTKFNLFTIFIRWFSSTLIWFCVLCVNNSKACWKGSHHRIVASLMNLPTNPSVVVSVNVIHLVSLRSWYWAAVTRTRCREKMWFEI